MSLIPNGVVNLMRQQRANVVTWRGAAWQQITFGIKRELFLDIERFAKAESLSRSEFVRKIMTAYIEKRIGEELSGVGTPQA